MTDQGDKPRRNSIQRPKLRWTEVVVSSLLTSTLLIIAMVVLANRLDDSAEARVQQEYEFAATQRELDRLQNGNEPVETAKRELQLSLSLEKDLKGLILRGWDMADIQLPGRSLSEANLEGSDLSGANLEGTSLYGAKLNGADLAGANLDWATLTRTELQFADLSDASLYKGTANEADLSCANASGFRTYANFEGAVFHGANLTSASFSSSMKDADLSGANLTDADLAIGTSPGINWDGAFWIPGQSPSLPEGMDLPPNSYVEGVEHADCVPPAGF